MKFLTVRTRQPIHYTAAIPVFLAGVLLFFASCNKYKDDFDFNRIADPEWNPEFAFPLVRNTFNMYDFFSDSADLTIRTNADRSLSFVYSGGKLFSQSAADLVHLPDQSFAFNEQLPVPPVPPGFSDTVTFSRGFLFSPETNTQRIDSISFKNGMFHLSGRTNLNRDEAAVVFTFPGLIDETTGVPLTINASLNNPGGQQQWVAFDASVDLSDYRLILSDGSASRNKINFTISLFVAGDNNPDLSPYDFAINSSMQDMAFEKIFGYLGNYEIDFNDSIRINLFDRTIGGGIEMGPGAVDLYIDTDNSFGAPAMCAANELYVFSADDPASHRNIYLFGQGSPNIFTIQSPGIEQVGQTAVTHLDFSQTNIGQTFNFSPDMLYYDFAIVTNPNSDTTRENFVTDTSRIAFNVSMAVKLFTAIENFVVTDTLDFNLDQNPEEIDYLLFRVNAENGFPLAADIQLYFTNSAGQIIDSLITRNDQRLFAGAPTNGAPDYRATEPATKTTDIKIGTNRIDHIMQADKMLLKAHLSTTGTELVKIYEDYDLQLRVGVITGLSITNGEGK